MNKRIAKGEPSILGYLAGGSKPVGAIGGALGIATGDFSTGFGLAGLGVGSHALVKGIAAKNPLTAAKVYETLSGKFGDAATKIGSFQNGLSNLSALAPGVLTSEIKRLSELGQGVSSLTGQPANSIPFRTEDPQTGVVPNLPLRSQENKPLLEQSSLPLPLDGQDAIDTTSALPDSLLRQVAFQNERLQQKEGNLKTVLSEGKQDQRYQKDSSPNLTKIPFSTEELFSLVKDLKSPKSFIDKAMDKAEAKMDGKLPTKAPVVIEAKRVDPDQPDQLGTVMQALFHQESGGKANAVSKAGAKGVGQLMDATGKELFAKYKELLPPEAAKKYDPFNAEQNKILSAMYMRELLSKYDGDLELALTAYNQGMGRVDNLLKIHNATTLSEIRPHLGPDGKAYAKSIMARLNKQGVIKV